MYLQVQVHCGEQPSPKCWLLSLPYFRSHVSVFSSCPDTHCSSPSSPDVTVGDCSLTATFSAVKQSVLSVFLSVSWSVRWKIKKTAHLMGSQLLYVAVTWQPNNNVCVSYRDQSSSILCIFSTADLQAWDGKLGGAWERGWNEAD